MNHSLEMSHRPRRSCLYLPGAKPRVLEKAKSLAADTLIFDLEDSVLPEQKNEARTAVAEAIAAGGYGSRELIVRINGADTSWHTDDIAMAASSGAHGLLVPKVETADDIAQLSAALDRAGAPADFALWAMVETPRILLELGSISAAAPGTRLGALVMGTNDLAKALQARNTPDRAAFQTALSLTVAAARAGGLLAIDTVYNDYSDEVGLRVECDQGRILGFDGKTLIHPAQIAAANEIFAPSEAEVAGAQAIIAAFDLRENQGKGVLTVNGKMVERLHLDQARTLTAQAEAIASLAQSTEPSS